MGLPGAGRGRLVGGGADPRHVAGDAEPFSLLMSTLTGAQKTRLRGLGQRLEASLLIGQSGATANVLQELNRRLQSQELVKVRFVGADRVRREELATQLAAAAPAEHVGSVGHTALFYRPNPEPAARQIVL